VTTGDKFLKLTSVQTLHISRHALDRIYERTGWPVSAETAERLFLRSVYTGYQELRSLGYRPAYRRRKQEGRKSWYFRFALRDIELVAVLSDEGETEAEGGLTWVTTYAETVQNEYLRLPGSRRVYAA
jgi:hypothetical protein